MEQDESFQHLPIIPCREQSHAPSCSETTPVAENEAEERTPACPPSSLESSPMMTPETSDDEDEDVLQLQLPEAACEDADACERLGPPVGAGPGYGTTTDLPIRPLASLEKHDEEGEELYLPHAAPGNWNEAVKAVSDMSAAVSERLNETGTEILHTLITTLKTHRDDNEDSSRLLRVAQDHWDVEVENALEQCAAGSESSHDESDVFHDSSMAQELDYGVLLSRIRKADRETLDSIKAATSGDIRSRRRIHRELQSVHEDETVPYLSVVPIDGNLANCLACMEGAPDTAYAGGVFWLHLDFPDDYPVKAPIITFLTPVYHPNIDDTGRICIDILEGAWSPCLQVQTLLLSVLSVLHSPIVDEETLVPEIAEKFLHDNDDFCDIVQIYTANANGLRPETSNLINRTPVDSSEKAHDTSSGRY